MRDDRKRQVVIWELGRKGPGPSAPESAIKKVMEELFGWKNCAIHGSGERLLENPPALILLGLGNDEQLRKNDRLMLWQFIITHKVKDICAVEFGPLSKTARDARLIARLAVSPEKAPKEEPTPTVLRSDVFLKKLAEDSSPWIMESANYLQTWVTEVSESIKADPDADPSEFLANLAGLAVDAEVGCEVAAHGDKFRNGEKCKEFKRPSMEVFRAWCDALKCMRNGERCLSDDGRSPIRVAVLDDRRDFLDKLLLPDWLWRHSEFSFDRKTPSEFQDTIDACTEIGSSESESLPRPDIFLLDMDWRHADQGMQPAANKSLNGEPLTSMQSYLLDLALRYNDQIRFEDLQKVAKAWSFKEGYESNQEKMGALNNAISAATAIPSIRVFLSEQPNVHYLQKKLQDGQEGYKHSIEYLTKWLNEYSKEGHNEGVVVYHYLKAFDEFLPTVVFTADHEDNIKLRQTAGPNSDFISKYALMENPSRLLASLRTVFSKRQRKNSDYREAAKRCRALLEWQKSYYKPDSDAVSVEKDLLVKKTKTRVMSLVKVVVAGESKIYFGRNFELSQPTGSMCAERSAIAAAIAGHPKLGGKTDEKNFLEEFKLVVILGDPANNKRKNPCPSCGVCSEWIGKLTKMDTVMFSSCIEHFCYYPRNDRISY